jgi:hypothetical protein
MTVIGIKRGVVDDIDVENGIAAFFAFLNSQASHHDY